jgi:hypothetical protein
MSSQRTPTASRVSSRRSTPFASRRSTPFASGRATPFASGISSPFSGMWKHDDEAICQYEDEDFGRCTSPAVQKPYPQPFCSRHKRNFKRAEERRLRATERKTEALRKETARRERESDFMDRAIKAQKDEEAKMAIQDAYLCYRHACEQCRDIDAYELGEITCAIYLFWERSGEIKWRNEGQRNRCFNYLHVLAREFKM